MVVGHLKAKPNSIHLYICIHDIIYTFIIHMHPYIVFIVCVHTCALTHMCTTEQVERKIGTGLVVASGEGTTEMRRGVGRCYRQ